MKVMRIILGTCIYSIFAMVLMVVNFNIVVHASENEEMKFNSVIEVESYTIEEGYIEPGKEAHIILTLHNANIRSYAYNILVSFSSESGMIYPTYGNDNQYYIRYMDAGDEETLTIPVIVNSAFTGDYADLKCEIMYVSGERQITNQSTMILPAQSSNTVLVSSVDVSAHATLNSKSLLSVSYYNKSTVNIDDAVLHVNGNVSKETESIGLGTVTAGKTYTEDFNVIFSESGEQNISITLDYTDINGEKVQQDLGTFTVTVDEENVTSVVEGSRNQVMSTVGLFISLLAFAAVIYTTFMYIKKR